MSDVEMQMRSHCLSEAIRAMPTGLSPEEIVSAAETFRSFVLGKKSETRARKAKKKR